MDMHRNVEFSSASSADAEGEESEEGILAPSTPSPAESERPDESPTQDDETKDPVVIHARAYQLEMFEESLKQNIIVAMDTGTGKTQVAVLRIQAELDMSGPEKLIWFLAPTVALCVQQFEVLKAQIRSVQIKLLSGGDNYDAWSEPHVWEDFLRNVRIVRLTAAAHRCVGKHPGSRIMARYRSYKAAGLPVPAILGLTASPVMKSSLNGLEEIEATLDAVCKSPSVHRDQLMSMVKRPEMTCILYAPPLSCPTYTKPMASLYKVTQELDIYSDPYILRLCAENTERSRAALQKALEKRNTKTSRQIQSLCRKSDEVWRELGAWAADYFIYTAINQFVDSVKKNDSWFGTWESTEKQYLASVLQKVEVENTIIGDARQTSDKVNVLIRELLSSPEDTTGIVFVRQAATVVVLAYILSALPSLQSRFRVGSMLGTSRWSSRGRNVGELYREDRSQHLQDFQDGKLNLLVATEVLEEGIDVPACNLVVCFDPPANLKSFIQRRGRARARESRLIMIVPAESSKHMEWAQLEMEMKEKYEDELREIQRLADLEEEESPDYPPFRIPKTGAQLDFDQVKSHLEHVCASLTSRQYVESRPYYLKREMEVSRSGPPMIKETVVLPVSFPPHLRRFEGSRVWYSEKNATKDAAFQAFIALYEAGLVNDHLMPLKEEFENAETRAARVEVNSLWNPWLEIARSWDTATSVSVRKLRLINQHRDVISEFDAGLPSGFPDLPAFNIYWDKANQWRIEVGEVHVVPKAGLKPNQSMALIDLAYGHRWEVLDTPHVLHLQSVTDLPFQRIVGRQPIEGRTLERCFLIRYENRFPFCYESWLASRPSPDLVKERLSVSLLEEPVDVPWLALKKWPRRQDFLHPVHDDASATLSTKPYQSIRPAYSCTVDGVHVSVVHFGALIPSIMHKIEVYLVVDELCKTVLKELAFSDLSLVATAISSSAAREETNYQRLEFLGDTILKLLTSVSVAANHVVESLIGASLLDGGMSKALACIRTFIPEIEWHTLDAARDILASQRPRKEELPSTLSPLEELIGYSFHNKALAGEAMTHASFNLGQLTDACMERLEFIGDAVLDDIVVSSLWNYERELTHQEMHLYRTASVNADLLGFLVMEWTYIQEATSILEDGTTVESQARVPVWKLMRHSSQSLSGAQSVTEENHALERTDILQSMREGSEYPWALLAHLQIPKSFSDLFESILGAVWVDSGSMDACREVVERAGILPYLRRLLADRVDVTHPKNKLGELAASDQKEVAYETELRRKKDGDGDGGDGSMEWVCRVLVAGELLVEVGGGVSREEVVTKAADVGYDKLLRKGATRDEVMT
ncbi:hypothetical protein DL769_008552 [Monosporascus sp. CRB-8-3]|nr:hypothetical protein DL769_008552 [Monosporascus sp. CRB-8-3]